MAEAKRSAGRPPKVVEVPEPKVEPKRYKEYNLIKRSVSVSGAPDIAAKIFPIEMFVQNINNFLNEGWEIFKIDDAIDEPNKRSYWFHMRR